MIVVFYLTTLSLAHSLLHNEPFLWGAATAAYQIEGSVSEDGRGPCIWDEFSKLSGKIHNGDNASIADNSYHKMNVDIELIKRMKLNAYRFSISWSRIMPMGYGSVNQVGIDHYHTLIDRLLAENIMPLVTLYHWDLPQGLEDKYGGWLSPQIESDFVHFADICFKEYGDKVKKWTTLNEPWTNALHGYVTGVFAPGRCSDRSKCAAGNSSTEGYIAAHNMLNAHAAVVELYRTQYQSTQKGIIGITLNHDWGEPLRPHLLSDILAAQRRNEFAMGWFGDPVTYGRYPQSMVDLVGDRLPKFTEAQKERLAMSYDFIGLNHYTSKYYFDAGEGSEDPFAELHCDKESKCNTSTAPAVRWGGWSDDQQTGESKYDLSCQLIGPQADSTWLNVVPWGFHHVIMWFHDRYSIALPLVTPLVPESMAMETFAISSTTAQRYSSPLIYITENGCDVPGESSMSVAEALNDTFRIDYHAAYLEQMDRAIQQGANIVGYFAWSLLDNFEWADGFSKRFGLHYVDYTQASRPRYPKRSSDWYAAFARSHSATYSGRSWVDDDSDDNKGVDGSVDDECSQWFSCLMQAWDHSLRNNLPLFDL